jgi:hypothetical protein
MLSSYLVPGSCALDIINTLPLTSFAGLIPAVVEYEGGQAAEILFFGRGTITVAGRWTLTCVEPYIDLEHHARVVRRQAARRQHS